MKTKTDKTTSNFNHNNEQFRVYVIHIDSVRDGDCENDNTL